MLQQATSVNITIRAIERVCDKLNIRLKDTHKTILAILIPAIIYRDGSIIILSETIHQINRVIQKKNPSIDFVSILLGYNCITHIDKYGAITIPLAYVLNKLNINREIVGSNRDKYLSKKVLTNATMTLCISEVLTHIGIPYFLSIPVINIIFELVYSNVDEERKMLLTKAVAFKGKKVSETHQVLKQMQFEKIFVSTALLLVITNIGFKIGTSLILINVIDELYNIFKAEYKMRTAKGFLKLYNEE